MHCSTLGNFPLEVLSADAVPDRQAARSLATKWQTVSKMFGASTMKARSGQSGVGAGTKACGTWVVI